MKRFTLYAGASLIILLGLIFTQSRSGVSLGMLTIFLSAIVFSVKLKNNRQAGLIFSIAAIVLMLAIEIGLVPILNRFAFEDPLKDSRWLIYSDTARAIGEFLPLGSGFGSFSQVYARFQSQELLGVFINHAHNDYLEWLMEGGIVVAGLLIGFLTLFAIQLSKLWGYQRWSKIHYIQVGAAIGIIAIGLHSLFDFNLHIPANQIYFASLCGLFFRPTQQYGVTIAKSTI
jgi:O-antigen ligase